MATNLDVITDALRKANIINVRETPSDIQGANGLTLLNDMMADWQEDGIELGFFPQTSLSATIPVENKHLRGIKANLARAEAADHGIELSSEAVRIAELTYDRLAKSTTETFSTDFSHIPRGRRGRFNITTG